ncbi:hypothetical protein Har1130_18815 [Haloarcula sp. CBA1130]|nr:hypothetical protein Har1130_18815 [Haloarcula sp. CBA1130]
MKDMGVVVAVFVIFVGTLLPWVRKLPAGYTDGEPYYTDELVWGLNPGFELLDALILAPALTAILALILVEKREWITDLWLLTAATPTLWLGGQRYLRYQVGATYAIEPGLYLVLVGGLLLITLGVGDLVVPNRTIS